eukprot:g10021.t1
MAMRQKTTARPKNFQTAHHTNVAYLLNMELLIVTQDTGGSVWDLRSGTELRYFNTAPACAPATLSASRLLISPKDKPALEVWSWRHARQHIKCALPERVLPL